MNSFHKTVQSDYIRIKIRGYVLENRENSNVNSAINPETSIKFHESEPLGSKRVEILNYKFEQMETLKTSLNDTKTRLDYYWELSKKSESVRKNWIRFTDIVDVYKNMRKMISSKSIPNVTNAWMKYWEIFCEEFPVEKYNQAFFNAELPGAALSAFIYRCGLGDIQESCDWRASSYLGEGSLQDTYNLYRDNKDKWLMDTVKNNGDCTVLDNVKDMSEKIKLEFGGEISENAGCNFYSHDAGMDCSVNFNDQELINAKLHLGCALAGLLSLRLNGGFVAKQYTFFETFTWNLILIYAGLFEEFYICKPVTSRASNSEIYLIGKGFLGLPVGIKELLSERLVNFNTEPLIPSSVLKQDIQLFRQLHTAAKAIHGQQTIILSENIDMYEKYTLKRLEYLMKPVQKRAQEEWLNKYF